MPSPHVSAERVSDHIALIRFTRPEKKNALHSSMVMAMADYLDGFAAGRAVRCVVLTGTEAMFAAGAAFRLGMVAELCEPHQTVARARFPG